MDRAALLESFRVWLWTRTGEVGAVSRTEAREKAREIGVPGSLLGSLINQSRCERVGEEYRRICDRPKPASPPGFVDVVAPPPDGGHQDRVAEWIRQGRALGLSAGEAAALKGRLGGG